tara:strand:+ start:1605 stop:1856 length:252 start_codon:yes stop_codon:yes gene_type:complete
VSVAESQEAATWQALSIAGGDFRKPGVRSDSCDNGTTRECCGESSWEEGEFDVAGGGRSARRRAKTVDIRRTPRITANTTLGF